MEDRILRFTIRSDLPTVAMTRWRMPSHYAQTVIGRPTTAWADNTGAHGGGSGLFVALAPGPSSFLFGVAAHASGLSPWQI